MAKKKEAHHGGAWKVAFADFMTAMMALFLVLWISAQDQEILIATSQYFQSPFNSPLDNTSGVLPFESNASPRGEGGEERAPKPDQSFLKNEAMHQLAREFYRLLNVSEDDPNAPMRIDVTSDGLRVTLFDRSARPLFAQDSAEFTEWGRLVVQNLAWLIDRQKFRVVVEGHTRSGLKPDKPDYSEWDLSTDQANATRRALSFYAVDAAQFDRITGFGSSQPLRGEKPDSPNNQRITLSLSLYSKVEAKPATEMNGDAKKDDDAKEKPRRKVGLFGQ